MGIVEMFLGDFRFNEYELKEKGELKNLWYDV